MRDSSRERKSRLRYQRVRVYHTLRTAHLERAHEFTPSSIVYLRTRYDFEQALTEGLDVRRCSGLREMAWLLARSDVRQLEINEPLMLYAGRMGITAVLAARLGALRRRHGLVVATYALENLDPFEGDRPRLRSGLRRSIHRVAIRLLMRSVDRIAFGSAAAAEQYQALVARQGPRLAHEVVPALPAACGRCAPACPEDKAGNVLFLGAFDERKGLRQVLEAWSAVADRRPDARLRLLGKGPLESLARQAATSREEVELLVDPPRDQVHEHLRTAQVLVLLSQPSRTWREQIGLPIVEGLAHGCEIVTTSQTGLADWLTEHGHLVLSPTATPAEVADAICSRLDHPRPPHEILDVLPLVDGRSAAESWMFDASAERSANRR